MAQPAVPRADAEVVPSIGQIARHRLRQPGTYVMALVVGTFINLYGHVLVPWMRGETDVTGAFVEEFARYPGLLLLTVGIAYCFPFCVGLYASVATRYAARDVVRRAWFPDLKPDPVFRVSSDGEIVDMGGHTARLFEGADVKTASDVLGPRLWEDLLAASKSARPLPLGTSVRFADACYTVTYSCAPQGAVNVYLSQAPG